MNLNDMTVPLIIGWTIFSFSKTLSCQRSTFGWVASQAVVRVNVVPWNLDWICHQIKQLTVTMGALSCWWNWSVVCRLLTCTRAFVVNQRDGCILTEPHKCLSFVGDYMDDSSHTHTHTHTCAFEWGHSYAKSSEKNNKNEMTEKNMQKTIQE